MFFGALAALSLSFQSPSTPGPAAVSSSDALWLWIALGVGALALVAAGLLAKTVLAGDTGTPEMRVISDAIREGAEAFLARQYRTIGILAAVLAVVVFLGYYMSPRTQDVAVKTVISFLVGACRIHRNVRFDSREYPDCFGCSVVAEQGFAGCLAGWGGYRSRRCCL